MTKRGKISRGVGDYLSATKKWVVSHVEQASSKLLHPKSVVSLSRLDEVEVLAPSVFSHTRCDRRKL